MKRFALALLILIMLLTFFLSRDALSPDRFTGIWYDAGTGESYLFAEGIIQRTGEEDFRGAYAFTRDSITLFVTDMEKLEQIQTLKWRFGKEGQTLRSASGEICFRRIP